MSKDGEKDARQSRIALGSVDNTSGVDASCGVWMDVTLMGWTPEAKKLTGMLPRRCIDVHQLPRREVFCDSRCDGVVVCVLVFVSDHTSVAQRVGEA